MKHFKKLHRAPVRVIKLNSRRAKIDFRRTMLKLKLALAQEGQETKEMLAIYTKATRGRAQKHEMEAAHAQFFDILKGLGLGVFAVLPFAPITIPLILKLAQMVGVDLLPSSFSNKKDDGL